MLLGWVFGKTITQVPPGEVYTVLSVIGSGIIVMILMRLLSRPAFFHVKREKYTRADRDSRGSVQSG